MSGVQKVESRGDRVPNGPCLGRPSAEPSHLKPESVARALSRALPVRCPCFGARRILRRLVLKPRFSQGIRGLFESCPLRCKTLVSPGFFAFLASSFGRL